jgi:hypothetical protein
MNPEPAMQRRFSIAALVAALAIFAAVLGVHTYSLTLPDRLKVGGAAAELRFDPVRFNPSGFAPLRLLGAWRITSHHPGLGGISALALDGGELLALTDSGVVMRFPKPGSLLAVVSVRDLPDGPGDPDFKMNRDSEAFARDPGGRGWWVAFENSDELWLYDYQFRRALERRPIPTKRLAFNKGIEGLASSGSDLLLLPEEGGRVLRLGSGGWTEIPLDFAARRSSDLAALPDGSLLAIERDLSIHGIENSLVRLTPCAAGYCLDWRKRLPVGLIDNVEGVAVEPLPSGSARLWMVTDDDSAPPRRTVLIAAELPPKR